MFLLNGKPLIYAVAKQVVTVVRGVDYHTIAT